MSHNTLFWESKQGDKKDKKTHDRKASTKGAPADKAEKADKSAKCAYCGKAGHNILVCFKLIGWQPNRMAPTTRKLLQRYQLESLKIWRKKLDLHAILQSPGL